MITVKNIVDHLDLTIKGQDAAKLSLAKALFLHKYNKTKEQAIWFSSYGNIDRKDYIYPHLLLTGPTGCGKTEMVTVAAELLELPVIHIDAATITPSGYVGDSLSEMIMDGLEDIYDEDKPYAVIFIDEFDKLVGTGGLAQDLVAFKKACQYELLKVLEGHSVSTKEKGSYGNHKSSMTTDRFCFIFAGNFPELRKEDKVSSIGFGSNAGDKVSILNDIGIIEGLQKLGLATQILGRINFIGNLDRLSKDDLTEIAKNKNMALSGMYALADAAGLKLGKETLAKAVTESIKSNLGARGLRFTAINDLMDKIFTSNIGILDSIPQFDELEALKDNKSRIEADLNNIRYMMDDCNIRKNNMLSDAKKILDEDPDEVEKINQAIVEINLHLTKLNADYVHAKKVKTNIIKEIEVLRSVIDEIDGDINILGKDNDK